MLFSKEIESDRRSRTYGTLTVLRWSEVCRICQTIVYAGCGYYSNSLGFPSPPYNEIRYIQLDIFIGPLAISDVPDLLNLVLDLPCCIWNCAEKILIKRGNNSREYNTEHPNLNFQTQFLKIDRVLLYA